MPTLSTICPGFRVGSLTVQDRINQTSSGEPIWRCQCDCGGSLEVSESQLLSGAVTSCGCISPSRSRDLTGARFGKLVALYPTLERKDGGSVVWRCQCDCGGQKDVPARRLTRGKVRSCGCLSDPPPKAYVGMRFGRLTVTAYAGRASRSASQSPSTVNLWRCRCDCGKMVTVAQPELQSGDTQSCGCLHTERTRESLGLSEGTSAAILERVRRRPRRDNVSGHTGVYQLKNGYYQAKITFRKKTYDLGRYKNREDAIRARETAEAMHEDFLAWYYETHPKTPPAGKAD